MTSTLELQARRARLEMDKIALQAEEVEFLLLLARRDALLARRAAAATPIEVPAVRTARPARSRVAIRRASAPRRAVVVAHPKK